MKETEDSLLRSVTRAYAQAQRLQAGCCGATSTQCQILCAIGEEESLPQAELGARLGLEKSWVSRAVDRLAGEGLVERRRCCSDARMYDVAFTEKGREKYRSLTAALNAQAEDILSRIPGPERDGVRRALALLADALSGSPGECRCNPTPPAPRGRADAAPRPAVLVLRSARPRDFADVAALLRSRGLPTAGVEENFGDFLVGEQDGTVQACGGFERHGRDALVRSVAVSKAAEGRGVGRAVARELERRMREAGIGRAYLLTDKAREFWEGLGFVRLDRDAAPEALRSSEEFRGACPVSAALLAKDLEESL